MTAGFLSFVYDNVCQVAVNNTSSKCLGGSYCHCAEVCGFLSKYFPLSISVVWDDQSHKSIKIDWFTNNLELGCCWSYLVSKYLPLHRANFASYTALCLAAVFNKQSLPSLPQFSPGLCFGIQVIYCSWNTMLTKGLALTALKGRYQCFHLWNECSERRKLVHLATLTLSSKERRWLHYRATLWTWLQRTPV